MKVILKKQKKALTLIEIMAAMALIFVAVIGAMSFRYYCALDARKADVQITAARLASTLLQAWRATQGSLDYNPVTELGAELPISDSTTGPVGFAAVLGSYAIVVNHVNYYATLSYEDQADEPRRINANVAWNNGYQGTTLLNPYQSVRLTTYIR